MARGDKPYLRKSTDRKAQISPLNWTNAFLICALRSVDFSGKVYHPEPPHAQSLFLFPIVFGINLIHFFNGKKNRTGLDLIMHLSWVFDPSRGSCHLKEGEQSLRAKRFLAMESVIVNHCEFQRHHGDLSAKGETKSAKGETKSANFWQGKVEAHRQLCEFLARESVNSSPILARQWWRHFSLSLCLYLSLPLSPKVPHAQYRKRFHASYNKYTRWTYSLG